MFGKIEEDLINVFWLRYLKDRKQLLEPTIQEWIHPGTHIVSEGWSEHKKYIENIGGGLHMSSSIRPISSTPNKLVRSRAKYIHIYVWYFYGIVKVLSFVINVVIQIHNNPIW